MGGLTERLFTLVDLLQSRGRQTTEALARELGVSERTVRRDIVRLRGLDVQLDVTPGRHGGVALEPGSLLPALRFTDDETLALGLGLMLVRRSSAVGLDRATASASRRLSTVLGKHFRSRLEALEDVLVEPPVDRKGVETSPDSRLVLDLAESIKVRRSVELSYRSRKRDITERRVDPYGMVHFERFWYLAGYCHLREDVRVFRLDRIRNASPTRARFDVPTSFDAFEVVNRAIVSTPFPGTVTCRVRLGCSPVEASRLIPPATAMLEPLEDGVLLTVHYPAAKVGELALHLLGFPFEVEVLEPAMVREALVAVAERAMALAGRP